MSIPSIQGHLLEVTVVGCTKLKNTEWISRQDPYVCFEYGSSKSRTNTCKDGGINPSFQEKFVFTLVEGLREINVFVWNSNSLSSDVFIGGGKIQLEKVLYHGFDDTAWPLQSKSGRLGFFLESQRPLCQNTLYWIKRKTLQTNYSLFPLARRIVHIPRHAGEVRVILRYENANKPSSSFPCSAPPYPLPSFPSLPLPAAAYGPYPFPTSTFYHQPNMPHPYSSSSCPYPSNLVGYPPPTYPPPHLAPYQQSTYPPPPSYPPPPQGSPYHPSGVFPRLYPPPY